MSSWERLAVSDSREAAGKDATSLAIVKLISTIVAGTSTTDSPAERGGKGG